MKYKRIIFKKLSEHIENKEFSIIIGARQTGKTTLLMQLKEYLTGKGRKVYFISLEDMIILDELNKHPENVFRLIPKPENEKFYLLIDEIQYLSNPSNFLKLLYDLYFDKLKIIATGSSAFYIDKKFKDSLSGRKRIFELFTLDFEEYLMFNNASDLIPELHNIRNNSNYISLERAEILKYFSEYLIYGGYPAVALQNQTDEKIIILRELLSSYLKKDILECGIQHDNKFIKLITILSHQTGSLLNINELANTIGLSVSAVRNYINILEKSFHINTISPFYSNIRKELTKMPKLYFNDLGLRNVIMNNFNLLEQRTDRGEIVENYIFIRLKQVYGKENIKFWRTADGNELDFVYFHNNLKYAVESKYNHKEFRLSKYKKFSENYPNIPVSCRAFISETNDSNIIGM